MVLINEALAIPIVTIEIDDWRKESVGRFQDLNGQPIP